MTAFPKPRPAALERKDRRLARKAQDEAENQKVKARSGGQCELRIVQRAAVGRWTGESVYRCALRAIHIHHKIGGWGKRARGASILAENKLHLCERCHSEIHAHVLVPDGDYFRRQK